MAKILHVHPQTLATARPQQQQRGKRTTAVRGWARETQCVRFMALARERGAKVFELRAAMSAVRLERAAVGTRTARRQLAAVLAGFTEGFDGTELLQARALSATERTA